MATAIFAARVNLENFSNPDWVKRSGWPAYEVKRILAESKAVIAAHETKRRATMETTTTTTTNEASTPRKTGKKVERTPLKSICSALRIDPKAARRLLRKASGLSFHGSRERWSFTESQAEKVREILKASEIERATPARKAAKKAAEPTKQ